MNEYKESVLKILARLKEQFIDIALDCDYQGKQLAHVIEDGMIDALERELDITSFQKENLEDLVCEAIEEVQKHYKVYEL